ncbi:MAG TPA: L-threonylcarbamoyladenylate synthase [Chthoniobacterales bacterium]
MTSILSTNSQAIETAVDLLIRNQVVALPTETVYGLAANATNAEAVARIFEAKNRPSFDPLIVHVHSWEQLETVAVVTEPLVHDIAAKYWPGPLTFVLPKRDLIPDLVTSGSSYVAVRMPAHPVFREVLQAFGKPLAAPSANRFGRISPTEAAHVMESLGGKIPLILDGGPCITGIESTIVKISEGAIYVLRDGPVSREELSQFGYAIKGSSDAAAPGQLASHYAPGKSLSLVNSAADIPPEWHGESGFLAFKSVVQTDFGATELLSPTGDLVEAAARLFGCLHRLDAAPVARLWAERVPSEGLGRAIMDRLTRASVR